jgi:hypothetical protein
MTLLEASELSRIKENVKLTHTYFLDREYIILISNFCVFEDGYKVLIDDFIKDKPWFLDGWTVLED